MMHYTHLLFDIRESVFHSSRDSFLRRDFLSHAEIFTICFLELTRTVTLHTFRQYSNIQKLNKEMSKHTLVRSRVSYFFKKENVMVFEGEMTPNIFNVFCCFLLFLVDFYRFSTILIIFSAVT